MAADVVVREATAADIPAILPLVREYWNFEAIGGFDEDRLGYVLGEFFRHRHLGCGWIAERGAEPVGYLLACYVFSLEHEGLTAEIDEFYLVPGVRSVGLGRRMLAGAETTFRGAGCTNVALQLARGNDEARRFYSACGYRERGGYELMDKTLDTDL